MSIKLAGLASNMDTDTIVQQLMSAHSLKKTKLENKITKLEWKQEKWKDLNTKIYSLYTGSLSKMRMQGSYTTKKVSSTNESAVTATATSSATNGSHQISVTQLASAQYTTGSAINSSDKLSTSTKLTDLGIAEGTTLKVIGKNGKEVSLTVNPTDAEGNKTESTINDFLTACKSAELNASFDATQKRFFISSKDSGANNSFKITSPDTGALDKLGLGSTADVQPAADAKFTLDGAEMTSTSNKATVNGISLTFTGTTSSPVTLSVSNDVDAVYDMVKSFVSDYNDVLSALNDAYYAGSARGYDPLTDDEKEAMTESEIEKWETKIKDSLLRRDDKLGSLLSAMKTTMSAGVKIDGTTYSLASYGISSALYTEQGKLHIDGDPEDSLVSDQTDKLRAALEKDPDTVIKVLSNACSNLYTTMQEKMKTSTLSSALTFYNDKEMATTLTKYKKELSGLEDKLKDIEDRYYAQFTAMETAMATLNSQTSALSSMLG